MSYGKAGQFRQWDNSLTFFAQLRCPALPYPYFIHKVAIYYYVLQGNIIQAIGTRESPTLLHAGARVS